MIEGQEDELDGTNLEDGEETGAAPGDSADQQAFSDSSDPDSGDSPDSEIVRLRADLAKKDKQLASARGRAKTLSHELAETKRTGTSTNRKLDAVLKAQAGTLDSSQLQQHVDRIDQDDHAAEIQGRCRNLYASIQEDLAEYGIDTMESASGLDPDLGAYLQEAIDAANQAQERTLAYAAIKISRILPGLAAQARQNGPGAGDAADRNGNPRSPSKDRPPMDNGRAASARGLKVEDVRSDLSSGKINVAEYENRMTRLGRELPA